MFSSPTHVLLFNVFPSTLFPYVASFITLPSHALCRLFILKISCFLLLSLLLLQSAHLLFFSSSPLSFTLIISLQSSSPLVFAVLPLSSPPRRMADRSSVWPPAFFNGDSASGNQVLYSLCSGCLSAGVCFAWRYD